jgi:hypothetical protein
MDFVVCTLALEKKKLRAGFDMSDRTIPLLVPSCQEFRSSAPTDGGSQNVYLFQNAICYQVKLNARLNPKEIL